ncbi:MAG: hypothetical protein CTY31_02595 [Hyphomicrobium sp.]|nr:MAG: hypothetical protein CTY39_02975 [Hyphomicrobium sp.]PPD01657.1 MAG: hypothetical protein CTY31_02595 [Hyphomicrobium sp.]
MDATIKLSKLLRYGPSPKRVNKRQRMFLIHSYKKDCFTSSALSGHATLTGTLCVTLKTRQTDVLSATWLVHWQQPRSDIAEE